MSTDHKTGIQLFDQGMLFLTFSLVLHTVLASDAIHGDGAAQDQIIVLHGADKESRGYSRSCALRYESPIVQSKIYRESRSRTLSERFLNRKALVIFDAERLPLAKSALHEDKIFSIIGSFDPPTSRPYYVSWYMKYRVPGEGTELVYLLHDPAPSDAFCLGWKLPESSFPSDPFEFPCLYPPRGVFHLDNADQILRFDANGRRIGDPDWPIRMTVMAIVFEAIQVVGSGFGNWLSRANGFESQVLGCKSYYDMEIVSYSPHFRQFDLLDDSKPFVYTRAIEPGFERNIVPVGPTFWKIPNCYLLSVRPAGTISRDEETYFWAIEIKFRRPFTVNRLTSAWLCQNAGLLTPTGLYDTLQCYAK